jgi:hypothetical protein
MENELIVSNNITSHSASDLCSSNISRGPDFIGSDGLYCDMGSKTLTPLCSTEDVDGCLAIDDTTNTVVKRTAIGRRNVELAHKSYRTVKYWS